MKLFLKIAGGIIAVLLALMLIVPIIVSDKIGEIVKKEANEMVNARVDFDKLDVSLFRHFPKASLDLKEFSVVGIDRFEGDTLVYASRISVAVDLFSIFGDSFEVSKVVLDRPQIYGRVLADGTANWDIMKESEEAEQPAEEEADEEDSAFRLSINDVRISDAKIFYTDESSKMHFHTAPLNLALRGDLSADQTTLAMTADAGDITFINEQTTLASGLSATLKAAVEADLRNNKYTLSDNRLTVNSVKAKADGWVQLDGDDIITDIVLDCSDNNFRDILSLIPAFYTKDFNNLTASGDVSLVAKVKGRMSGDNLPAFSVGLNVDKGQFKYADLPKSVTDIVLRLKVDNPGGPLDATLVDVSRFGASFAGNTLGAAFSASTPISDLAFRASANGRIDLGAVKDIYPLDGDMSLNGIVTLDVAAAGRMSQIDRQEFDKMQTNGSVSIENMSVKMASLPPVTVESARATVTSSSAALEKLNVKVGASDLRANGSLSNYWGYILKDATLTGRLSVESELLDLNELMAAVSSDEQPQEAAAEETAPEGGVIEVPKNLNLTLDSKFRKVLFQKMVIENLKGAISVRNGVLTLDQLAMDLFNGKATASAKYSTVNEKNPDVSLDAKFTNASFRTSAEQLDMLEKIAPIFAKIDGTYSMSLTSQMTLDGDMNPVYKTVQGKGQISSGNLKVGNIAALDALSKVLGGNNGLNNITTSEATVVSFTIKDGNVITKPFDIKIGKTKLTLSGLTGLDQSIDYDVAVTLAGDNTLYGKIGGTFSSPKVTLDAKKVAEQVVGQVLEKAGITEEKVSEELRKQADALIAEAEKAGAKLVEAAKAEKQKLVDKSSNAIAKVAAEAAGNKLVSEAEKQSAKLVEEARKKADELLNKKQQ